jgi:Flp pilus assembly protein TadD
MLALSSERSSPVMPHPYRHAELLFIEGNRYLHDGDHGAAEACFIQARALAPDSAEIWANLAFLKEGAGLLAEAETCYRQALLLLKARRFSEAERLCRLAVELAGTGEPASALSNLGVLLACTKREAEAERCYRDAVAVDATYAKAHFNLSYFFAAPGAYGRGVGHA